MQKNYWNKKKTYIKENEKKNKKKLNENKKNEIG